MPDSSTSQAQTPATNAASAQTVPSSTPATDVAAAKSASTVALPTLTPVVKATPAPPQKSVAAGVNAAVGMLVKPPAGVHRGTTRGLDSSFLHAMLYGPTDARKTTSAAAFAGPANTLFVLTRGKEQLLPISKDGYPFVQVSDGEGLMWALQNPEAAAKFVYDAPGLTAEERANLLAWEKSAERTLIVDDTTEGAQQIVDDNRTNDDGKELKDGRKIYGNANIDFREVLNSLKRKPMHTIFIGLSKIKDYGAENKETIMPNLPSGIHDLLVAELEFVFYCNPAKWKFLTARSSLQYTKLNEKGKPDTFTRDIFAKRKLPLELELLPVDKKPVKLEEEMNLRAIWERIKAAKEKK